MKCVLFATIAVCLLAFPATDALAKDAYLGVRAEAGDQGLVITEVLPDAPAFRAGLKVGDVILALDNGDIEDIDALVASIQGLDPGDRITMKIQRGSETINAIVTLGARGVAPEVDQPAPTPAKPGVGSGRGWLGIYMDVTEDGVTVNATVDDGPAQRAGIEAGDRLVAIDGVIIEELDDVMDALEGERPGTKMEVVVERDRGTRDFVVELGATPAAFAAAPVERSSAGLRLEPGSTVTATAEDGALALRTPQGKQRIELRNGRRMILITEADDGSLTLSTPAAASMRVPPVPPVPPSRSADETPARIIIEGGKVTVVPKGQGLCACQCCQGG